MKAWKIDQLGGKFNYVDVPIPEVPPQRSNSSRVTVADVLPEALCGRKTRGVPYTLHCSLGGDRGGVESTRGDGIGHCKASNAAVYFARRSCQLWCTLGAL
jgi:hypothetical protein